MRKISILTVLAAILTFSSCEEDAVMGCTDSTATNYDADATENDNSCEYAASVSDQILGNWNIDSSTVGVLLPQDMLTMFIMMSSMMSPEDFEEEMGFPMPSSQAEWDEIALNGFTQDAEITGTISLTSTMFTLNDTEETMELAYELVNDDTIQFTNPDPDEDLEYFTIEEVSETNLTLTTSIIVDEEDMSMESIVKIYLSK